VLRFPDELGQCHGTPLVFFDTNVILDSDGLLRYAFRAAGDFEATFLGVICDFIEGEVRNLRQGLEILEEIKNPASIQYSGFYFKTTYDSYAGARRSLEDMPTPEMAEAVRVEYDKKLDSPPPKELKKKRGDSKFGDFSLLTVATISAFRRKRQSVVVSRDRWVKLACDSLAVTFQLQIHCQDPRHFSAQEILDRSFTKK
jgi:hypothetical protein